MKSIFLLLITAAVIFFFIVAHRIFSTRKVVMISGSRQARLQQMLMNQKEGNERKGFSIKELARRVGKNVRSTFYGKSRADFIKNMLIPPVVTAVVAVLNHLYLSLPAHWVILVSLILFYPGYAKILVTKRKKLFLLEFGEALITFNGAISSGRTFLQAMSDFSAMRKGMLAQEFGVISRRLNRGESPDQVFTDSWSRYPYREYYFFIVAVLLNINSGGRLKEVLAKLQKTIASNIAMESKMLSMTSEMRMASKITGAIPFVFLLLLKFISPDNFNFIFETASGRMLLYYLLGSELTGIVVLKYLMRNI
jgi:tight adherence protein B